MLERLKTVITDYQSYHPAGLVRRGVEVPLHSGSIVSIVGPRRAGKTWLLYSIMEKARLKGNPDRILYFSFEDERFSFSAGNLQMILDAWSQLYPDIPIGDALLLFDEIQEVDGWEKFLRRISETVCNNIVITGSSAKMLSREIATSLRGRAITCKLFPLSFREYLRFRDIDVSRHPGTDAGNLLMAEFKRFVEVGGYPAVQRIDDTARVSTLQSYVDTMLYRDIIERHGIKRSALVKELARRIMGTNAQTFSVNKVYNDLKSRGVHTGKDALYELCDHLEDAFFAYFIRKYDPSVTKSEAALRKVYVNDTGLLRAFAGKGWLLETAVCLELLKCGRTPFYYSDSGYECDFVTEDLRGKVTEAIQVCADMQGSASEREIRGLVRTALRFDLHEGTIVTLEEEYQLEEDDVQIRVVPAWKWCLDL
jgi:hypothetical protein